MKNFIIVSNAIEKCLPALLLISQGIFLSLQIFWNSTPNSPIKYERKLGKYFETENKSSGGMIDLSEGPKLRYNANFGPKDLNFDIKIINPY